MGLNLRTLGKLGFSCLITISLLLSMVACEDGNIVITNLDFPQGIFARVDSANSITLGWGAVSGAKGYYIYRSEDIIGPYEQVGSSTITVYTDASGLTRNTEYYYRVAAYNNDGIGTYSNYISAKTDAALNAPDGIHAIASSATTITVTWVSVPGVAGYHIYRATSAAGYYYEIASTPTNSYIDTEVYVGATYYYKVAAYDSEGEGEQSNYTSATLMLYYLAVPANVGAQANSANSITVTWSYVSGASGYYVYRSTDAYASYGLVGNTSSNSYTDTNVSMGQTYYYRVAAYNYNGTSSQSEYISVTTPQSGDDFVNYSSGEAWVAMDGSGTGYIFKSSGAFTGIEATNDDYWDIVESGTYERSGSRLTIWGNDTYQFDYYMSGDTLTLEYYENGNYQTATFIRMNVNIVDAAFIPSNYVSLTETRWADGTIDSDGESWFEFTVVAGRYYYVWWNDSHQGDGTKTLDVAVTAYYSDGSSIFYEDARYDSAEPFFADRNGSVYLKVTPFSDGNTGTFAIVYSTNDRRP